MQSRPLKDLPPRCRDRTCSAGEEVSQQVYEKEDQARIFLVHETVRRCHDCKRRVVTNDVIQKDNPILKKLGYTEAA